MPPDCDGYSKTTADIRRWPLKQPKGMHVARLHMLVCWMHERQALYGVTDLGSSSGSVHLDGTCPDIRGKKLVLIGERGSKTDDINLKVMNAIEILAVLGHHTTSHNVAVSSPEAAMAATGKSMPILVVLAAVLSVAATLPKESK